jgi:hypothetical protein
MFMVVPPGRGVMAEHSIFREIGEARLCFIRNVCILIEILRNANLAEFI